MAAASKKDNSKHVVIISLLADIAIACVKLVAGLVIASASMIAEAVHSFLDCANQVLLLYGRRLAHEESDLYPLGRDRELFFWSFVVSLLLFTAGGIFSVYEGILHLSKTEALQHPYLGIGVIAVSLIFELVTLRAGLREVRKQNRHSNLWKWVRNTASADLLVVFLTNLASLFGLAIALIALIASWLSDNPRWDGYGSIGIGLLLVAVALIIAREMKSLLIGEATSFDYRTPVEEILKGLAPKARILQFLSLQRGLNNVLLAYKLHPGDLTQNTKAAIDMTNRLEDSVRAKFKEVSWQFVELDTRKKRD